MLLSLAVVNLLACTWPHCLPFACADWAHIATMGQTNACNGSDADILAFSGRDPILCSMGRMNRWPTSHAASPLSTAELDVPHADLLAVMSPGYQLLFSRQATLVCVMEWRPTRGLRSLTAPRGDGGSGLRMGSMRTGAGAWLTKPSLRQLCHLLNVSKDSACHSQPTAADAVQPCL